MLDGSTPFRTVHGGPVTGLCAVVFALGLLLMIAPFLVVLVVAT